MGLEQEKEMGMGLSGLCRGKLEAQLNTQQSFFLDNSEKQGDTKEMDRRTKCEAPG